MNILAAAFVVLTAQAKDLAMTPVAMPGGGAGIGFDDLGWAPGLRRVIVPGGRTGKIFLLDPASKTVMPLGGFSTSKDYQGGHGEGVTSADEGAGLIFGADRDKRLLAAISPKKGELVAEAALTGGPDYVRFVDPTREVWVSEPNAQKIEVFTLSSEGGKWALKAAGEIPVPGGPESLVISPKLGKAFTHLWKGATVSIDLKSRKVSAPWKNGCAGSRGIAVDEEAGLVFAGCDEGKAVALDARSGKMVSTLSSGSGVDVIAYDPKARRLFLPGEESATMAVIDVARDGKLSLKATAATAKGSHCVTQDGDGGAWVCDPQKGRLLYLAP